MAIITVQPYAISSIFAEKSPHENKKVLSPFYR